MAEKRKAGKKKAQPTLFRFYMGEPGRGFEGKLTTKGMTIKEEQRVVKRVKRIQKGTQDERKHLPLIQKHYQNDKLKKINERDHIDFHDVEGKIGVEYRRKNIEYRRIEMPFVSLPKLKRAKQLYNEAGYNQVDIIHHYNDGYYKMTLPKDVDTKKYDTMLTKTGEFFGQYFDKQFWENIDLDGKGSK